MRFCKWDCQWWQRYLSRAHFFPHCVNNKRANQSGSRTQNVGPEHQSSSGAATDHVQWWVVWYWDYRDGRQISTTPTTDSMTLNVTSSGLGVVLKFLKFWNLSWNVLKLVRSWNLYIYPEIFTRFHIFFKNTSFFLFYLWVSNTGHKESSVVPDFSIKMACRGHSRSIILRSLESR